MCDGYQKGRQKEHLQNHRQKGHQKDCFQKEITPVGAWSFKAPRPKCRVKLGGRARHISSQKPFGYAPKRLVFSTIRESSVFGKEVLLEGGQKVATIGSFAPSDSPRAGIRPNQTVFSPSPPRLKPPDCSQPYFPGHAPVLTCLGPKPSATL